MSLGTALAGCPPMHHNDEDVTVGSDADSARPDGTTLDIHDPIDMGPIDDRPNPTGMDVIGDLDVLEMDTPNAPRDVPNPPMDVPTGMMDIPTPPVDRPNPVGDVGPNCAPFVAVNGAGTSSTMNPLMMGDPTRRYPCFTCPAGEMNSRELNLGLGREYLVTLWARGRLFPADIRRWGIGSGCTTNGACVSQAMERGIASTRVGPGLVSLFGCSFEFQYEIEVPPPPRPNTSCATAVFVGTNQGTFDEARIESASELYYSFTSRGGLGPSPVIRATSLMNTGNVGSFSVYSSCGAGGPSGLIGSAPNNAFLSGAGPTVDVSRLAAGTYYVVISRPMPGIKYTVRYDNGAVIP